MARVLVVDDDPDIRGLVERQLVKRGHLVIAASSALEALALVDERGDPEVAVLDVTMPGMSGLQLLQELRGRAGLERLPVVFLSARVQPEDIDAGTSLGATYLTKPFVAAALQKAIERAMSEVVDPVGEGW